MKDDLVEAVQKALVEGYTIKNKKLETESKPNFLPVSELPDICYGILPSDSSIIVIKKGENGYYQTDLGSPDNVEKVVDDLNEKLGVTPDQRFTMELRSMSGNWSDKKTEAYSYNWQDDIEEVENTEENDELVYAFAENLMETDPYYSNYDDPWEIVSNIISIWKIEKRSKLYDYLIKWYGSEEEMKKHIRSFYETNNAIYFETGVGYSIFDADLLGGNADGRTAEEFSKFVANGGKKDESKKVEVKETTTDLAGIDYRNSSRGKTENKKVTEAVDENKVNLYDTVWDTISSYDEEYAKEQGIDKLDDEDVYNIIAEILNNNQVKDIIREEIESYAGYKNS